MLSMLSEHQPYVSIISVMSLTMGYECVTYQLIQNMVSAQLAQHSSHVRRFDYDCQLLAYNRSNCVVRFSIYIYICLLPWTSRRYAQLSIVVRRCTIWLVCRCCYCGKGKPVRSVVNRLVSTKIIVTCQLSYQLSIINCHELICVHLGSIAAHMYTSVASWFNANALCMMSHKRPSSLPPPGSKRLRLGAMMRDRTSKTASVSVLQDLHEAGLLEQRFTMKHVKNDVHSHSTAQTPYGSIIKKFEFDPRFEYIDPVALLYYLCTISEQFAELIADTIKQSHGRCLKWVLYQDGVIPGNRPEKARKVEA